ncbi:MAG: Mut7-C RNAse domain-containing protein [bacterium]
MTIHIRFYEELNDYLPEEKRKVCFTQSFATGVTLEDTINHFTIPVGEVDLILLNGKSAGLEKLLHDGDRVSIYPVFESFDISDVQTIRERPLRQSRFILDVHLGKLAFHLRMFGFDTMYRTDFQDHELVQGSIGEQRILLSKDRSLLKNKQLTHFYEVKDNNPRMQLIEVMQRFDLYNSIHPFTRCLLCNTILLPIEKESVLDKLPEKVKLCFNHFMFCRSCERVYWPGSHFEKMKKFINEILNCSGKEIRKNIFSKGPFSE